MVTIESVVTRCVKQLRRSGYYPTVSEIEGPSTGPTVIIDGEEYANFASNCYLGLSRHPKVIEAAQKATKRYGAGSGASRMTAGTLSLHRQLEETIAEFKGVEDAIVFSAGALVNLGAIPAITNSPIRQAVRGYLSGFDLDFGPAEVFLDSLDHASIIDGSILAASRGTVKVTTYAHRDMTKLRKLLARSEAQNKLIITDGVFSLHGHIAPLQEIVDLAEEYGANVYVDDAHAVGVLGMHGRGTSEYFGIEGRIAFQMGTLSKALASAGGYMTGTTEFCDYLRIAARTYMYQTAMPPAQAAAAMTAIELVRKESSRRFELNRNAQVLRDELNRLGYNICGSETQIIPILVGEESQVKDVEEVLMEERIFAPIYFYPAVRRGEAIIRINVLASHKPEHFERLVAALKRLEFARELVPA